MDKHKMHQVGRKITKFVLYPSEYTDGYVRTSIDTRRSMQLYKNNSLCCWGCRIWFGPKFIIGPSKHRISQAVTKYRPEMLILRTSDQSSCVVVAAMVRIKIQKTGKVSTKLHLTPTHSRNLQRGRFQSWTCWSHNSWFAMVDFLTLKARFAICPQALMVILVNVNCNCRVTWSVQGCHKKCTWEEGNRPFC